MELTSIRTQRTIVKQACEHSLRSTTFYGRDRGEKGIETKSWATIDQVLKAADHCGTEYVYLYDQGTWYVADRGPQFFGGSDGSVGDQFAATTKLIYNRDKNVAVLSVS